MSMLASMLVTTLNFQQVKAEPRTIIVPDDYEKIQWALGNASDGDTIYVRAGVYNETIVENGGLEPLSNILLMGESRSNTTINGSVTWDEGGENNTIQEFQITGSVYMEGHGSLEPFEVTIVDSIIHSGLALAEMYVATIKNNVISGGIDVICNHYYPTLHVYILNNTLADSGVDTWWGWAPVTMQGNRISGAAVGVNLNAFKSTYSLIGNNVSNCGKAVLISGDPRAGNADVQGNTFLDNDYGIYLSDIQYAPPRVLHNNFINNTVQAATINSKNVAWDDGYPSGGNYWSHLNATDLYSGPGQNQTSPDGIADSPYIIDVNNTDSYPLVHPWGAISIGENYYLTIQKAINSANQRDTIRVKAGTYHEALIVNKTVSLTGQNSENTIIDGNGTGHVVNITADNVSIDGFTVRGGTYPYCGVFISSRGNSLSSNTIENNGNGIRLDNDVQNNTISGSTVINNIYGVTLDDASANNTLFGNKITNNQVGVYLYGSSNNKILRNHITANSDDGLRLSSSSNNNTILENELTDNWDGVDLQHSSSNAIFHNNFINNTRQAYVEVSANSLNTSYESGGGNYWNNYLVEDRYSGPCQNENGSDGICDSPLEIDTDNIDHYPIINPWGCNIIILKVTAPEEVVVGSVASIHVDVKNEWSYGVPLTFNVTAYANNTVIKTLTVNGLAQGSQRTLLFEWNTTGLPPATIYTTKAEATLILGETNASDNVFLDGTTTIIDQIHDVAVTNVTASETTVYEGDVVHINVTIKNEGTAVETFNVTSFYDENAIETRTGLTLTPGVEANLTFNWNTSGVPGNHRMSAEASIALGETDTEDNTYVNGVVQVITQIGTPINGENATIEGNVTITRIVVTKNTLHFDASGPPGATGWINATFPAVNTTRIKVFINRELMKPPPFPTITTNAAHYYIYFEFNLNSHEILISFGPLTITILSPENKTYCSDLIPLTFAASEPTSWVGFSLDSSANVTAPGNTTLECLSEGPHCVQVYANDTSGNMRASSKVNFSVGFLHDVAIINVATSKSNCSPIETVGEGYNLSIYTTVENQGNVSETFNVTAYANMAAIEKLQITLGPGENKTITFKWDTTGVSYGNYAISATAETLPFESETADNTLVGDCVLITIAGDVDGDKDVDIYDVVRMSGAYGILKPDLRYDSNSDWDDDGDIDIYDIVIAADNYHNSWQP